ncbi:hypothetical protein SPJ221_193 [Staphylococcus phage vB_SauH_SPJ2]|uniref:Uncharacterized protein n=5 Tax=Silviavirus remus TaxID=1857890 RepID=A0A8E5KAZ3_9CAUD|nr:hypothetical protein QLX36_gp107 [Staphylococcus phage vB_SauM_Romulus]YP_008431254.1 hypothetical protein O151_gp055 [Staphylococcus phage vB_SauM_Remus]APC43029.1 hypothetical protein SAP1_164 [Staphylococcus phage StAP1]QQO38033.1 hypothetical protein LSA2308_00012 [Staphylococcus phage LSA2308]QVD57553.1 hypothetical protein PM56_008 [Staphylococcus phage PM56]QVD58435.1 hypothetical protein PM93_008 [Staphylococcus phage PM93]QVD58637.1 hypothetical protein Remus_006 [Silviavirus remu
MTKVVSRGYSFEEQEVSMNYNQGQWVIYASRKPYITDIMKKYPDKVEVLEQLENETPVLVKVVLDEDLITLRKPISNERKEQMKKIAKERFGK